jgi:hypothetical protein
MRLLCVTVALAAAACVATPDVEYAPDDAGSRDARAVDGSAAKALRACVGTKLRCSAPSDCCSGRCKLENVEAVCD